MKQVEVLSQHCFRSGDSRYGGVVEVVRATKGRKKTVGVRLRVGSHNPLPIPRHAGELIEALKAAEQQASHNYAEIIEEMNR